MFAQQQLLRGQAALPSSCSSRVLSPSQASTSYHTPAPLRHAFSAAPGAHQHQRSSSQQARLSVRSRAGPENGPEDSDALKRKFFSEGGQPAPSSSSTPNPNPNPNTGKEEPSLLESLDAVNPYQLGRQARQAFDDLWSNVARLSSPTRSFVIDEVMEPGRDADFEAPQAAYTTVLVVGATGRVGRILVRKLLLRGYTVKALVRKREGSSDNVLPAAVEVIYGDVGDMDACQKAVKGVNKVRSCSYLCELFCILLHGA